ncbi:MAG TPA: PDZ domain-containing protein [Blastocatellia bacterium]|nr:PDZ domain-containing protein [Blastocatellia bacterium]
MRRPSEPEPQGWVWITLTQSIDVVQQLGGEENIMTLDGEPLPDMMRSRITLGLIIDDEGHIVTRLIDVTPSKPPAEIMVKARGLKPTPAKFLGMDAVSGLCVLKVNDPNLKPATLCDEKQLPARSNIRVFGFHPNQSSNFGSVLIRGNPRLNFYHGQIVKAVGDYRYNPGNPIYHLLSPRLTPVQDGSLILDKETSVFGLAIYDTGSGGPHLVYPISQIQSIAQAVIKTHNSIAHGWLGAAGMDTTVVIPTGKIKPTNEDLGVRVTAVAPDSPAEMAGVRAKDILLSVNEQRVETKAQLASIITRIPANSEVTLKVKRGSEYKNLRARLAPAPAIEPEEQPFVLARRLESMEEKLKATPTSDPNRPKLESRVGMMRVFLGAVTSAAPPEIRLRVFYGFEVQPLSGQLMHYFAVTNGLLVSNVVENSKEPGPRLMAGDVILKVGATPINNLAELLEAMDKSSGNPVEITISRRRELLKFNFQR